MLTVERFVATQRQLLSLEQDEETEQSRDLLHGQSGIVAMVTQWWNFT